MLDWFSALAEENQLKALALVGAAVAFMIGLFQYRRAQKWKRAEWVAHEMETFFRDPVVRAALCMMDWGSRLVELHPDRETRTERLILVTDDSVAKALQFHEERTHGFTEDETAIRDIFDHFLDRLERIQSFVEAGLITVRDVSPYLRYWAEKILGARVGDPKVERLVQLRRFIGRYGYAGVARLLYRLAPHKAADGTEGRLLHVEGTPQTTFALPADGEAAGRFKR